ncbi:epidermal growth factor receptor kinase substrate 8-like protein 2 isoform X1 [Dendroctonus ponderosae]|uniref:epidermal growth factor receptor kinase substrate 8-like protein 2 isoform X1 n=2 Tax=Dendroctonus ponderosae TaxID=77166 RepID=UPI0020366109|nr:epidermal growth factor receptor kinase substrate 8-like protein 2 isoform X1 [Dendroctonus ponderosae]
MLETIAKMAYRNGYTRDDRDLDRDRDRDMRDDGKAPIHLIEHLATFSVSPDMGILYPIDGMRRLRQMEQTNGIWSQKMQLCLDHPWVLILDESGTIVEKFPVNAIQDPTAFMSTEPMDMYNNILVFIIADSSQSSHSPEMQMHIFQCQSISAQDLVEDLKQLRMGKPPNRSRKSSIPPPSHKPPQPIVNPARDHSRDYFNQRSDSELTENNDDASSTTSEKYERDVTILNHCFDDIEKFIARLQHSAAAVKELDRKRKNRRNKKRDMGDGMLTMRAKPPPEKEFIDIFQKFKLSFNLLAKLKAHIHDPNAPELVHFLFTPLALIVESSHDYYFDQHIPQNVTAPLLTREAINLLMNCVTSKETELWHSLGNAWQAPREQYRGHVPSYHPVFMDGWSPEYPVDEPDSNEKHYPEDDDSDSNFIPPILESTAKSDISVDSIEIKGDEKGFGMGQERFLEELQNRGAHIVQVTYPRTANNDKELTVVRGEFLEILDSSRKWWKARNSKDQIAHVPNTIVTQYHSSGLNHHHRSALHREDSPPHSRYPGPGSSDDYRIQTKPAEAIRNERQEERTVKQPPQPPPLIPVPVPPPPPPAAPLPPPPPPPVVSEPSTPNSQLKRTASRQSMGPMASDAVQEELNSVLTLLREKEKVRLDIRSTPETYIDKRSNPKEVQAWLKAKDFNEAICSKFKGVTGYQLLAMSKQDLEKVCGEKTGARLHSFLLVQKSVSGFKTYRTTELQRLLAKQREKIEQNPGEYEDNSSDF